MRLYHGTWNVEKLVANGFTEENVSGYSSGIDVEGVHLTKSLSVAKAFAKTDDGGVVLVHARVRKILRLTETDIERRGVTLIRNPSTGKWQRYRSKQQEITLWKKHALSKGTPMKTMRFTLSQFAKGTLSPSSDIKTVPLIAFSKSFGYDAVEWPGGSGMPWLQHQGEREVTVFDPSKLEIIGIAYRKSK